MMTSRDDSLGPDVLAAHERASQSLTAKEHIWLALTSDLSPRGNASSQAASNSLSGVAFGVKDNIFVEQLPVTAGTPALADFVAPNDAPVVAKLRAAGAVPIGKTQMHELGFGVTSNNQCGGAVPNPYLPDCWAGGSSGGSAAAVAAGHVRFALGTDTGGSARLPAIFCGVYGFRPSGGRWPADGIVPISRTRDTAGVIADSIALIRLVDDAITGESDANQVAAPVSGGQQRIRLGVPEHFYTEDIDDSVRKCFDEAVKQLTDNGIEVLSVSLPTLAALDEATGFPIALYESRRDLGLFCQRYGIGFESLVAQIASPDVRDIFAMIQADAVTTGDYDHAMQVSLPSISQLFADLFETTKIDALLAPACAVPAPPLGNDQTVSVNGQILPLFPTVARNTSPASLSSHASLAIPLNARGNHAGKGSGILLEGRRGSDRELLRIGEFIASLLSRRDDEAGLPVRD